MSDIEVGGDTTLELARDYLIGSGIFDIYVTENEVVQQLAEMYPLIKERYDDRCFHHIRLTPKREVGPLSDETIAALSDATDLSPYLNHGAPTSVCVDYLASVYLRAIDEGPELSQIASY